MIIACPHCQTKYQVTYEAIGSAGRKVQCAHCKEAWQQAPLSKPAVVAREQGAVDAILEDELDETLLAEEKAVSAALAKRIADEDTRQKSATAAKVDPAIIRKRQRAFSRRQDAIASNQPLAQLRRAVRVGLALLLCAVVAGAFFARVQIVARYPAMAGVYAVVGLGVNVIGLDFTDVSTQRTLRSGKDVLVVSAQIVGRNAAPTRVPPVVITLLDDAGQEIYAWSIAPEIQDLMAGERATFDTQLVVPPGDAQRVRLSFAEPAPPAAAIPPSDSQLPEHALPAASADHPAEPDPHSVAGAAEHSASSTPNPSEHH